MTANRTRWLAAPVLVAYTAILIRFVVFKAIPVIRLGHIRLKFAGPHTGPANFIPFKTIGPQLVGRGNHLIDTVNLLGNIVPFLPIGLLAPLVFRSMSWTKALVLGVAIGLSFELMEAIFRVGIFDVDDILLNACGVIVGYGVFRVFQRLAQPRLG